MTDVLELRERVEFAERTILMGLPAIDLIQDQVSKALCVARENSDTKVYLNRLRASNKLLPYSRALGNGDFWNYHIIMATVLSAIPNASESSDVKKLDNLNKDLTRLLADIQKVTPAKLSDWKFKDMLSPLVKYVKGEDVDAFTIRLQIISDVLTNEDYDKARSAGAMYLLLSFRLNKTEIPPVAQLLYDDFQIVATKQEF